MSEATIFGTLIAFGMAAATAINKIMPAKSANGNGNGKMELLLMQLLDGQREGNRLLNELVASLRAQGKQLDGLEERLR